MRQMRLQESRRGSERKVIYEGNGFAQVIKNGRVVERIQLERGDNLSTILEVRDPLPLPVENPLDGAKKGTGTFPSGTYYIGDLSHVIRPDEWNNYVDSRYKFGDAEYSIIELSDGSLVGNMSTAFGDGKFKGSNKKTYAVDSGSIGIITMDSQLVDTSLIKKQKSKLVTFSRPFEIGRDDEEGDLYFDDIMIITDPAGKKRRAKERKAMGDDYGWY